MKGKVYSSVFYCNTYAHLNDDIYSGKSGVFSTFLFLNPFMTYNIVPIDWDIKRTESVLKDL